MGPAAWWRTACTRRRASGGSSARPGAGPARTPGPVLADQHNGLPEVGVAQVRGGDQEGPPGDFRNLSFHGSSFYYTAALPRLQPPLTTPRGWTILER